MLKMLANLPASPPQHTHTLQSKENEKHHSRMEGNWSDAENFGSQECKQKQKLTHTTQIIKQKTS